MASTDIVFCFFLEKQGLGYLLKESSLEIVSRDINVTTVLLDQSQNVNLSDFDLALFFNFDLAKLGVEEITHISKRTAGTIGYMVLEYSIRGYLTYVNKCYLFRDCQRKTMDRSKEELVYLFDWVYVSQEEQKKDWLIYTRLRYNLKTEKSR